MKAEVTGDWSGQEESVEPCQLWRSHTIWQFWIKDTKIFLWRGRFLEKWIQILFPLISMFQIGSWVNFKNYFQKKINIQNSQQLKTTKWYWEKCKKFIYIHDKIYHLHIYKVIISFQLVYWFNSNSSKV